MIKIGLFYGSTTGTTEDIARRIASKLNVSDADIHDVSGITEELIGGYDVLIFGSSTWGDGDLQDDWYDAIKAVRKADISHKFVALFGCGDCEGYSETFCDAIGILYEELKETGCTFCGAVSTGDYTFDSSVAVVDGAFVGLPIDDTNEGGKTNERVSRWVEQVKKEINYSPDN